MQTSFLTRRALQLLSCFALVGSIAAPTNAAYADGWTETQDLTSGFDLYEGATETVRMNAWNYVEKLYVQTQAGGHRAGTFEVLVNGTVKGTIYVPAHDPSYVVTIAEKASSIQFRHVSGGYLKIQDVKAVIRHEDGRRWDDNSCCGNFPLPARNRASEISREAIELVDPLDKYTNYADYGAYLLPIKKAAAEAYSKAQAGGRDGDLSAEVQVTLKCLQEKIAAASAYLSDSFERSAAFDKAVQLRTLQRRIERVLQ